MATDRATPRNVICMKWGTKYGPEYVNRLYAMVRRHLSGDFRMVCLTDDAQGIRPEVDCFPIPPLDLPPGIPERGWTKLVSFAADLHGLKGTALFLDVDVVVVGSLDAFFEVARRVPDHPRLQAPLAHHRQLVRVPLRDRRPSGRAGVFPHAFRRNPPQIPQRTGLPVGLFAPPGPSLSTGLPNGAPASNTTAFHVGPPITGARPLCRSARAS